MSDDEQKLSIREKIAYGIGDSGANLIFQSQIAFLTFFYTDIFGLTAGTAGKILLISRIVDAVNDPIVGALADRTNTRWGRYRPWVLWTAIPLAALLVLCFTTPQVGATGKIIWAVVTYNALMIVYAANNVPYSALGGVVTGDPAERTSLLSWRFAFAMLSALAVNVVTLDLIAAFGRGDRALGFQLTMAFWGALAILFFAITFALTSERIGPTVKHRAPIRQDIADLLRNGPWVALFALAILIYIQLALRSGTMLYYFDYYLSPKPVLSWISNYGVFSGLGLTCAIIGISMSKPLVSRFGKRATFRACLLLSATFMAAFALVPRDSFLLLLVLQVLLHLAFGPTIPILWAMMADVADYAEWKTGRRSTALVFASTIFGLKLGFGLGGWFNGALLEHFGYTPNVAQSEATANGIKMMVSIIPAATLMLGVCVLWWYRLDDELVANINNELKERRAEVDTV
jgi:glycoside/pentoside/hexuronide:cation symporter, GPH family